MEKVIAAVGIAMACAGAQADVVVFDGGAPYVDFSTYYADARYSFSEAATKFSLNNAITFTGANWWGRYYPSNQAGIADDFTLTFYDGSGALPGDVVSRFHVGPVDRNLTGNFILEHLEYEFRTPLPMTTLAAGTYFIGLSNNNATADFWGWEATLEGQQLDGASYNSSIGAWVGGSNGENLAFQLTVPEPANWVLLAAGLAIVGGLRSRAGMSRRIRARQSQRRAGEASLA